MIRALPSSDAAALRFALLGATLMIAQQVAGKATRDALFLTQFDVTRLPMAVIGAAVLSLVAVWTMSRLLGRHGPSLLVPIAFAISAGLFVAEWALVDSRPRWVAAMLYLHMAVFGAVLISGFWSVVNERFDPHSAKERIAKVAAAAALGGLVGGIAAARLASVVGVDAMLLALAGLHLLCAGAVRGIGEQAGQPLNRERSRVRSGLAVLARSRYLKLMGALMTVIAVIAALLDYALKVEVSVRFTSEQELVGFFATFYAVVGIVTFALQTLLGPRILQRYGIGAAIAVLPLVALSGGLLGAAFARFTTVAALRGAHAVLANSIHRASFELLYTPITPADKRPTKTFIDVAGDRIGDMIGGGLILALLALFTDLPSAALLLLAALAGAAALWVVGKLHREYVAQLAQNLRLGAVELAPGEVLDATTRDILAETSVYSERQTLMARMKALRAERRGEPLSSLAPHLAHEEPTLPDEPAPSPPAVEADLSPVTVSGNAERLSMLATDLGSGDVAQIRNALHGDFMDVRAAPLLVPLLADDRLAEDAAMELKWVVPRIIGQLTDSMLDPDTPIRARQRIPAVLEVCHNPRAVDALLAGLDDPDFSISYACARALGRMRARSRTLAIDSRTVYRAILDAVDVTSDEWESRELAGAETLPEPGGGEFPGLNRSAEHVFTLLGLVLDPDALQLSMHALYSRDSTIRGTALEYLENVLSDDIRKKLWSHLGIEQRRGSRRSPPRR